MAKVHRQLFDLASNVIKRESGIKTALPDGTRLPREMIQEAITSEMLEKYGSMYYQYVPSKVNEPKEARKRASDQRSAKGKHGVSEGTIEYLKEQYNKKKELLELPNYEEFKLLSKEEQAEAFLKLNTYVKEFDRTQPSAKKFKADMEVARSRILNSSKVPLEIRRYLEKSDLYAVYEYIQFMEAAKKAVGRAEESYYQDMMSEFYDNQIIAQSVNTTERKILFNFIKYQFSKSDGDRQQMLMRKAASIKVRGKNVFSYKDLEGYL